MVSILDFIFPKKCLGCGKIGSYFCPNCLSDIEIVDKPICPVCKKQTIGGKTHSECTTQYGLDGLFVGVRYKGVVKTAIKKIKYRWAYDIASELISILISNAWRFELPKDSVLVPIPLHNKRKAWRGFNQAEIISKSIASDLNQNQLGKYLVRVRETKPQVGLSKSEREHNIKDAFSLRSKESINGKNILLVDDVFTSGATVNEACRILKRNGAKEVWSLAIALG